MKIHDGDIEFFDETVDKACVGILVSNATIGNAVKVLTRGTYRNDTNFSFTGNKGVPLYPTGSEGTLSITAPSDINDYVQRVAVPLTDDCILVNVSPDVAKILA